MEKYENTNNYMSVVSCVINANTLKCSMIKTHEQARDHRNYEISFAIVETSKGILFTVSGDSHGYFVAPEEAGEVSFPYTVKFEKVKPYIEPHPTTYENPKDKLRYADTINCCCQLWDKGWSSRAAPFQ